jgi:hypothetical protein
MMDNINGMALKTEEERKYEELHVPAPVMSQEAQGNLEVLMSGFASVPMGAELDAEGHVVVNVENAPEGPAPLGELE